MMLRNLFGELSPVRAGRPARSAGDDFANTAVLESDEDTGEPQHNPARQQRDLIVQGTPAETIRQHFTLTQDDLADGERFVTVFDPAQLWASSMIKALSDASGQPVDRLLLRDSHTLATLAVVERTVVPRRQDETLKIYHADVHAPGAEMVAISTALMERSDIVAVVVGPMHPAAVDAMIEMIAGAAASPSWRCPQLLFMLPVGALWIAQKIAATPWGATLQVHTLSEPLSSASAVWNKLLSHWGRVRPAVAFPGQPASRDESRESQVPGSPVQTDGNRTAGRPAGTPTLRPGADDSRPAMDGGTLDSFDPLALMGDRMTQQAGAVPPQPLLGVEPLGARRGPVSLSPARPLASRPSATDDFAASDFADTTSEPSLTVSRGLEPARLTWSPDLDAAQRSMNELMKLDGVLMCALVECLTNQALVSGGNAQDVERAAPAAADLMRSHRRSLRQLGHWRPNDPVDEVLVTAGSRYHVLRALNEHPDYFVLCVLDKLRCNLATTRFRIMEAQQALS
jgi:hypothetical protein